MKILKIIGVIVFILLILGIISNRNKKQDSVDVSSLPDVVGISDNDSDDPIVYPDDKNISNKTLTSGTHKFYIDQDGQRRYYTAYVPTSYQIGKAMPVVLTIHGGGGNGMAMPKTAQMNPVAEKNGFIAVYPAGTNELFKKSEILLYWNAADVGKFPVVNTSQNNRIDETEYFRILLDDLAEKFSIDEKRVYATGISNGGFMSYHLAATLPDRIAAIAPIAAIVSPGQYSTPKNVPIPIMHFHGTDDVYISYDGSSNANISRFGDVKLPSVEEGLIEWAKYNGCSTNPVELKRVGEAVLTEYPNCKNGVEVFLWTLENGGHTWPGGTVSDFEQSGAFDTQPVGVLNTDISASQEAWNFFKRHSL